MKRTEKIKKNVQGITLIALVVTIIVLLVLAGVAINLTIGNNGLFSRAQNAVNVWRGAETNEQAEMKNFEGLYDQTLKDLGIEYTNNGKVSFKIDCGDKYKAKGGEFIVDDGTTWEEFLHTKNATCTPYPDWMYYVPDNTILMFEYENGGALGHCTFLIDKDNNHINKNSKISPGNYTVESIGNWYDNDNSKEI